MAMVVDLERPVGTPRSHASVCIAGAGAAGIVLAVELASHGIDVILLESGGLGEEPATQALYDTAIAGHRHNGVHSGRYRIFGGTTTHWGGGILELDDQDFAARPWIPGSGWPFPKSLIAPYYRRAAVLEGLSSAIMDDSSVWATLRIPAPSFGDPLVPFFTRSCPQPDFTRLFGATLTDNQHIAICLHANVCSILLNESCDTAIALRCRTLTGIEYTFGADAFVFCLGGIETARLLLQPSENGNAQPWQTSGLVGRFFQDHIDTTLVEVVPNDRRNLHRWFDTVYLRGFKYLPKIKLSAAEQKRLRCLAIGATFEFHSKRDQSLAEFRLAAQKLLRGALSPAQGLRLLRRVPDAGLLARLAVRYKLQGRAFNPDDHGIFLRVHCEQVPETRSRISLTTERDAVGMLRCRLDWRIDDLEVATIRHFITAVGEAFRRSFATIRPFAELEDGGATLLACFDDSYHHMGATRMGSSARDGVVDCDLRLFGIRNGYVCSSAVFPSCGFANPTHTLLALCVRLADHLAAHSPLSYSYQVSSASNGSSG